VDNTNLESPNFAEGGQTFVCFILCRTLFPFADGYARRRTFGFLSANTDVFYVQHVFSDDVVVEVTKTTANFLHLIIFFHIYSTEPAG